MTTKSRTPCTGARLDEFYKYGHYLMEDYYPLTRFSDATDVWMAWQYNDPDDTSGIIQVFKRPDSTQQSDTYLLSGLYKDRTYVVTDIDTARQWRPPAVS